MKPALEQRIQNPLTFVARLIVTVSIALAATTAQSQSPTQPTVPGGGDIGGGKVLLLGGGDKKSLLPVGGGDKKFAFLPISASPGFALKYSRYTVLELQARLEGSCGVNETNSKGMVIVSLTETNACVTGANEFFNANSVSTTLHSVVSYEASAILSSCMWLTDITKRDLCFFNDTQESPVFRLKEIAAHCKAPPQAAAGEDLDLVSMCYEKDLADASNTFINNADALILQTGANEKDFRFKK